MHLTLAPSSVHRRTCRGSSSARTMTCGSPPSRLCVCVQVWARSSSMAARGARRRRAAHLHRRSRRRPRRVIEASAASTISAASRRAGTAASGPPPHLAGVSFSTTLARRSSTCFALILGRHQCGRARYRHSLLYVCFCVARWSCVEDTLYGRSWKLLKHSHIIYIYCNLV